MKEMHNQPAPHDGHHPLKKLWLDPVWSKVIAVGIIAILGLIARYFQERWPNLEIFSPIKIPLIYSIAIVIGTCVAGFLLSALFKRKYLLKAGVLSESDNFDRVFEAKESVSFYGMIADKYDERNTDELLQTHRAVVTEVKHHVGLTLTSVILDIGGGTGRAIAELFFDSTSLKWIYVDACGGMAERFRKNMSGAPLRTEAHVMTLDEAYSAFPSGGVDVIVMSFLISSLSERPAFSKLAQLLCDGGVLIVADADPAYTRLRPYYNFAIDDERIALRTNPIHYLELRSLCEVSGFMEYAVHPVMKRGVIYSYVAVFQKKGKVVC